MRPSLHARHVTSQPDCGELSDNWWTSDAWTTRQTLKCTAERPGASRRLHLFMARKPTMPSVSSEWQGKLPDFVTQLEEALYSSAPSKVSARHIALDSASNETQDRQMASHATADSVCFATYRF